MFLLALAASLEFNKRVGQRKEDCCPESQVLTLRSLQFRCIRPGHTHGMKRWAGRHLEWSAEARGPYSYSMEEGNQ